MAPPAGVASSWGLPHEAQAEAWEAEAWELYRSQVWARSSSAASSLVPTDHPLEDLFLEVESELPSAYLTAARLAAGEAERYVPVLPELCASFLLVAASAWVRGLGALLGTAGHRGDLRRSRLAKNVREAVLAAVQRVMGSSDAHLLAIGLAANADAILAAVLDEARASQFPDPEAWLSHLVRSAPVPLAVKASWAAAEAARSRQARRTRPTEAKGSGGGGAEPPGLPREANGARGPRGLTTMHRAGVIHRDIKPTNILLDTRAGHDANALVADFDLAVPSGVRLGEAGTTGFRPPEGLPSGRVAHMAAFDVFSMGRLLLCILADWADETTLGRVCSGLRSKTPATQVAARGEVWERVRSLFNPAPTENETNKLLDIVSVATQPNCLHRLPSGVLEAEAVSRMGDEVCAIMGLEGYVANLPHPW
ncbi:hypothetical protein HYH03_001232 [Edaphochlamys debaryana]|uniref:Protein kinase domain-containing protein n=1 Tax=Edaphochlamys debaryana TaxID=47281 RepID=A0A835YF87_9CHLO|nr:hypothetical protein HYH03_001232 [Edaphochlamys debaryana]|eukprot:KAG2501451.1 hypothetical protein HYH03_001232 [Edaphochlamys debaryana]